uniref:Uncharacterized protein n=1 Tax=blood disease bacterium R229 TaxID=741978 RepID=G2ZUY5_9RALS|nr:exported hypothetical protein [blood disease bacterium R229]
MLSLILIIIVARMVPRAARAVERVSPTATARHRIDASQMTAVFPMGQSTSRTHLLKGSYSDRSPVTDNHAPIDSRPWHYRPRAAFTWKNCRQQHLALSEHGSIKNGVRSICWVAATSLHPGTHRITKAGYRRHCMRRRRGDSLCPVLFATEIR